MATDAPKFTKANDVSGSLSVDLLLAPQPTGVDDKTGEITYDREPGEALTISSWPHTAKSQEEAALLRQHPLVEEVQSEGGKS